MSKSPFSYRRIDHLRQFAYDCKLSDDDARPFGKLTATKTWEALLDSRGLRGEFKPETSSPKNEVNAMQNT
jgi:hypothetical protein